MSATWTPHLRLTFGGVLGEAPPTEVWSNTFKWHCQGFEPTRAQLLAGATGCVAPLKNWMGDAKSYIHISAALTYVKLNWIQADGKQRDSDTVVVDVAAPNRGSVNAQTPPYYQTQAITLRTRVKRGRGHSGRIFPPLVMVSNGDRGTPYTAAVAANEQATAAVTMIRALRAAMAAGFAIPAGGVPDLAVHSPGDTLTGRQPTWTLITSATVDRVPDVQHRRTKQIPRAEGTTVVIDP